MPQALGMRAAQVHFSFKNQRQHFTNHSHNKQNPILHINNAHPLNSIYYTQPKGVSSRPKSSYRLHD